MSGEQTVFVVDDDEEARVSVCALVRSMGLPAQEFASGEELMLSPANPPTPGDNGSKGAEDRSSAASCRWLPSPAGERNVDARPATIPSLTVAAAWRRP